MKKEQTINRQMADKTLAGQIVPKVVGGICGGCAAKLATDILDNISPDPVSIGTKVVYGVGAFCIGDVVGNAIAESVEVDLKNIGGGLLMLKSFKSMMSGDSNVRKGKKRQN